MAPAELEAILIGHPSILDAAVVPYVAIVMTFSHTKHEHSNTVLKSCRIEDEAAGQIPVAYVVRAADAKLMEDQVIEFVNKQVAPYKKIRRVSFIDAIPRSTAGKILRRELMLLSKQQMLSKL